MAVTAAVFLGTSETFRRGKRANSIPSLRENDFKPSFDPETKTRSIKASSDPTKQTQRITPTWLLAQGFRTPKE